MNVCDSLRSRPRLRSSTRKILFQLCAFISPSLPSSRGCSTVDLMKLPRQAYRRSLALSLKRSNVRSWGNFSSYFPYMHMHTHLSICLFIYLYLYDDTLPATRIEIIIKAISPSRHIAKTIAGTKATKWIHQKSPSAITAVADNICNDRVQDSSDLSHSKLQERVKPRCRDHLARARSFGIIRNHQSR